MPLQFFRVKQHLTERFTQLAVKTAGESSQAKQPVCRIVQHATFLTGTYCS